MFKKQNILFLILLSLFLFSCVKNQIINTFNEDILHQSVGLLVIDRNNPLYHQPVELSYSPYNNGTGETFKFFEFKEPYNFKKTKIDSINLPKLVGRELTFDWGYVYPYYAYKSILIMIQSKQYDSVMVRRYGKKEMLYYMPVTIQYVGRKDLIEPGPNSYYAEFKSGTLDSYNFKGIELRVGYIRSLEANTFDSLVGQINGGRDRIEYLNKVMDSLNKGMNPNFPFRM